MAVAGSVGAGLADQFSDLELDCYWRRPPTDEERLAPVRALGGELTDRWDYDPDDAEWSEDYLIGELGVTVSNFLVTTIEQFLDDVLRQSTGHAAVRAVLALNHVYLPHRQLKWQHQLTTGLRLAPSRFAERLKVMSDGPPGEALPAAEILLAETVALAGSHCDADLTDFREVLSERRRAIGPPLA
jgi:hypothetical protein